MNTAKFTEEITVTDPDSNAPVELSVFKHEASGGMFAVDSSFLEQCFEDDDSDQDHSVVIDDPLNRGCSICLRGL